MTDSKDAVASAARILELENLLRSSGILVPSTHIKSDDASPDASNMEDSSPQPARSRRVMRSPRPKAKAKVTAKTRHNQSSKIGGRGRQPVMSRSDRALCRIMHSHGKTYQDIAEVVCRTVSIVATAVKNCYLRPDDATADYDFVDAQTKRMYPPKPSSILGKRPQDDASNEEPPAKHQKKSGSSSTPSKFTVDIPLNRESASQVSKKRQKSISILEFLRKLDMEPLHPKLNEAGVNDDFFVEFQSWTEKATGELLEDLVSAGKLNLVQAFKIRKALSRRQDL